MRVHPLIGLSLIVLLTGASAPTHYSVDTSRSEVSAKVAFFAIASKTARFPEIEGQATLLPSDPSTLTLDVTLDARALQAPDKVTLRRLKSEKFFWVEKYPTIRFVGRRMQFRDDRHGTVEGQLTARGVTRKETLHVTFDEPPRNTASSEPITLSGEMEINRRDYGMTAYRLIVGRKVTIRMKARMVPS